MVGTGAPIVSSVAYAGDVWDKMPEDVRGAIEILVEAGFDVVEARSGSMASGLVRLSGRDLEMTVTRDRGQWMFDFIVGGKTLDLDAVTAARTGRNSWAAARKDDQLPVQIPDTTWRDDVAAGLEWIRATPDASIQAEKAKRLRSKTVWP